MSRRIRLWLGALGCYYAVTGLWPAVAFEHFRDTVELPINAFQAWAFAAVIVPVGLALLLSAGVLGWGAWRSRFDGSDRDR